MRDLFISHSSKDHQLAHSICSTLESLRLRCWIAPRDISPGTMWPEAIIEGLDESRILVVVLSSHANDSGLVLREIGCAADRGLAILPVRIENVPPTDSMAFYLGVHQWLDAYTHPFEPHLVKLADAVKGLIDAQPERAAQASVSDETAEARRAVLVDAVRGHDAAAATNLGFLSLDRGDDADASRWFREGAEGGDAVASTMLGFLSKDAGDSGEAEKWFRQGAKGGDAMAATNLGLLLKDSELAPERAEAEKWLREGAEAGDAMAATNLGLLLKDSELAPERAEAERWLRRGAEAGDAMAATNLGLLIKSEAEKWLRRGAEAGDDLASRELRRLLGNGA